MKQKYRVTHQDIVDFIKTLPKEITSGRESIFTRKVYYLTQPQPAGITKMGLRDPQQPEVKDNSYLIELPIQVQELYTNNKRASQRYIDKLLYERVNEFLYTYQTTQEPVKLPKTSKELLAMRERDIADFIAPFYWVGHPDNTVSICLMAGSQLNHVPPSYLESGYAIEQLVRKIANRSGKLNRQLKVGFDPESSLFSIYTFDKHAIDIFDVIRTTVEVSKDRDLLSKVLKD